MVSNLKLAVPSLSIDERGVITDFCCMKSTDIWINQNPGAEPGYGPRHEDRVKVAVGNDFAALDSYLAV